MRLALGGPMGAGKSTVGRILADRWAVPFVDLDAAIGDVPALFATGGEAAFRAREAAVLRRVAAGEGVLALGGGTLLGEANRAALAGWRVVVLMGSVETLRGRIGAGQGRPLAGELEALVAARAESYRTAGPVVWTDGIAPAVVADRVEALC